MSAAGRRLACLVVRRGARACLCVGGSDRRTGRSIPDNGSMGAQGTRATDAVRLAGITHAVHSYAHDPRTVGRDGRGYALEAVAALGIEPGRVFKTIVVSVDGRL